MAVREMCYKTPDLTYVSHDSRKCSPFFERRMNTCGASNDWGFNQTRSQGFRAFTRKQREMTYFSPYNISLFLAGKRDKQ